MKCSDLATFILFADDTNIFVTGKNQAEAIKRANTILDAVHGYMAANKLHINMDKSCYMHFKTKAYNYTKENEQTELAPTISINGTEIKEVFEIKFLGVIIDDRLSWSAHISTLSKKLKCCTGQLNRIKDSIPSPLHKNLYHTLFESHLAYGITVWGGISTNKMAPVSVAQKHCIRILYGDKEAYLDKFKTSARSRPAEAQRLGVEFYQREHTKPLFNNQQILTVCNLYHYHMLLETFKIIKTRTPISLYSCFTQSTRKETLLITPSYSENFVYNASMMWNIFRTCPEGSKISDFIVGISYIKTKIKALLFRRQKLGDIEEWDESNSCIR